MSNRSSSKRVSAHFITSLLLMTGSGFTSAYAQTYTTQPTPSASATASAGTQSAVSLKVQTGSQGSYLVDSLGKSLYVFAADSPNTSTCTGACAAVWPPLIVAQGQTAQAQTGVNSSMIGSITRSDGTQQVTYNGQPLYRYSQDQIPGQTNGQGITSFGALWYLVQPNGSPLISSSAAGTAAGYGAAGTAAGYGAAGTSASCTYTTDSFGNTIYSGDCSGVAGISAGCTFTMDAFGDMIASGNCAGVAPITIVPNHNNNHDNDHNNNPNNDHDGHDPR